MPTGNEFSDVRLGSGDQGYKQTDREMSGGDFGQSTGQTAPQPSSGQYPNTFDGAAGSEPETISHYPDHAFQNIAASGPAQHYGQTERESVSGEYGQSDAITAPYYPGTNMVPSSTPSKQFSGK